MKKILSLRVIIGLVVICLVISGSVLAGEPQAGGDLIVADQEIQPSLDPHHNMGFGGFELYPAYNTLISYDQELDFVPELAVDWELVDDKTYVFYLRKGVEFHDGTKFDASAVKWNIERMMSDYSQIKSRFERVKEVKIVDDYTVEISLNEIYAPFLDTLAAVGYMVSPQAVEEMGNEGLQKHPVGTGPFKFKELNEQQGQLVFEKNPDYFKEGKPYLDKIILEEIPEDQTRLFSLRKGESNYLNGVPASSVEQLRNNNKIELVSLLGKSNTIDYLNFNCKKEPFSDKKVRLAVAYALDQQKIIQFLDNTVPLVGPLPEGNWGSNPELEQPEYNLEKARKLLDEAGYPDGFEVTLKIWNNDPSRNDLALITKDMLSEVGIDVKVEVMETSTLIQQISQNDFTMASLHWGGGGALDPHGNLHVLFSSKGQHNWIANYNNEEVDHLLERAQRINDRETRKVLYQKAEKIIYEDKPMIWFGKFDSYAAYSQEVHGVKPLRPAGYSPVYENIWLEQN